MMILEDCTKKTSVVVPLELLGDLVAPNALNLELRPLMNFVQKVMDSLITLTLTNVLLFLICVKMEDVKILLEVLIVDVIKGMPLINMVFHVVT